MKYKQILLGFLLFFGLLSACRKEQKEAIVPDSLSALREMITPAYVIDADSIRTIIRAELTTWRLDAPWDSALVEYYRNDREFVWLNRMPFSLEYADSMLARLDNIAEHGITPELYHTDQIRESLQQIRTLNLQEGKTMNRLLAFVEYQLTATYLSYVCQLKFGFLPPQQRRNDSLTYIPLKRCDSAFAFSALDTLRADAHNALQWAQPSSRLYSKLQEELQRINKEPQTDSTDYFRKRLLVNLERERWQYAQDKGKKYAIVNVAAFMLQAVNEETDSILEMRVCCGRLKDKTPMLASRIYYMELNPYWNVPQSIITKEIIPTFKRDTTYFTRNRMKIYDKNGKSVDPQTIEWTKFAGRGVPYTVKQDNKAGNSLGRIIFRFPNHYAVYLHDTPSRQPFTWKNRAVSHGCVRLENALDFAFFLLKKPDELFQDRIRIAMDIRPVSEEGRKLSRSDAYRELKHCSLQESIPVYLDYQTVYLSADNQLSYCADPYNYDPPLLKAMNNLIAKP